MRRAITYLTIMLTIAAITEWAAPYADAWRVVLLVAIVPFARIAWQATVVHGGKRLAWGALSVAPRLRALLFHEFTAWWQDCLMIVAYLGSLGLIFTYASGHWG